MLRLLPAGASCLLIYAALGWAAAHMSCTASGFIQLCGVCPNLVKLHVCCQLGQLFLQLLLVGSKTLNALQHTYTTARHSTSQE